ncbi:MAG: helix-turn-helix domain-containing protein [Clostridia bacterium]|nr:helix-turn-helix domain-containing protein [Clostridia bacterium]
MIIKSFEKYYHYKKSPKETFKGHRHGDFEANIVLSGELEITCEDEIFRLGEGEMGLWWGGNFHKNRVLSESGTEFIVLHFYCDLENDKSPRRFSLDRIDLSMLALLDEQVMLEHNEIGMIDQVAFHMLSALMTRMENRTLDIIPIKDNSGELYRRAVKIMSENIDKDLSVPEIAKLCNVCTTLIKNAFNKYSGKGARRFFLEMKLERAKAMLIKGEKIGCVSNALGFSSISYFSQSFKREYGISPRDFLKNIIDRSE